MGLSVWNIAKFVSSQCCWKKKHYCLKALDSVICERPPVVLQAWTGSYGLMTLPGCLVCGLCASTS